ncbi:hypothetical protein [Rossellomorea aquimaris]|nr:hypothetical protein [Rossellomorea aquimaris]
MGIPFLLILMSILGVIVVAAYKVSPSRVKRMICTFFEIETGELK